MNLMKIHELIRLLQSFDPNAEVAINPDITVGRYKSMPQNRAKRFSYEPDSEITERTVRVMGEEQNVVCIGLGDEVGIVNPMNR